MEKQSNGHEQTTMHHQIFRYFAKKRVDFNNAVSEFYIEDDLAYISCNINQYSDVIDAYSVKKYAWPKRDFLQYVEDNACNIPSEYPIVLELCGSRLSQTEQETITRSLGNYYDMKLGNAQQDVKKGKKKEILLLSFTILAALVLFAYWMLAGNRGLLEEALLVFFWFFLWELGDVVVFERKTLRRKRTEAAQLASIRVVFSDCFTDAPVAEEVKEEIMEEILSAVHHNHHADQDSNEMQESSDKFVEQDICENFAEKSNSEVFGQQDSCEKSNELSNSEVFGQKNSCEKSSELSNSEVFGQKDSREKLEVPNSSDKSGNQGSRQKHGRHKKYGNSNRTLFPVPVQGRITVSA